MINNKTEDLKLTQKAMNTAIDKKYEEIKEINTSEVTPTIQRNSMKSENSNDAKILKSVKENKPENKREPISTNSVNDAMVFSISVFANTEIEIPFLISSATSSSYLILGGGGTGSPGSFFHPHFSSSSSSSHFGHANRSLYKRMHVLLYFVTCLFIL